MQYTLKNAVKCSGVGVHSGKIANITLKPADVNTGITFIRTDVTDKNNIVPATWDAVTETQLCTVISNEDGVTVSTIEHLMSALLACGVDNAIVEIDSAETPIMDGSAEPFVFLIECTGRQKQNAARKTLRILKEVVVVDGDKTVTLSPSETTVFSLEIDFPNTIVGTQRYDIAMSRNAYKSEISRARTFGFLHEVEYLRKIGLARGGSLENAIVIDGDKILNQGGLRYKNEFVRHKILDAIGDLYLAGAPIMGHYNGIRAGHAMNNKALRALFAQSDAYDFVTTQPNTTERVIEEAVSA